MPCFVDLMFEKGPWLESPRAELPLFARLDELHVCTAASQFA